MVAHLLAATSLNVGESYWTKDVPIKVVSFTLKLSDIFNYNFMFKLIMEFKTLVFLLHIRL